MTGSDPSSAAIDISADSSAANCHHQEPGGSRIKIPSQDFNKHPTCPPEKGRIYSHVPKERPRTFFRHLKKNLIFLPKLLPKVPPYSRSYPYFSQTACNLLLGESIYLMKQYDRTLIPSHTFHKYSTVLLLLPILYPKVQPYSLQALFFFKHVRVFECFKSLPSSWQPHPMGTRLSCRLQSNFSSTHETTRPEPLTHQRIASRTYA